ncbi:hypothetical protein SBRCBS47491_001579 [Sporothrix bragantina]|uniref:Cyanovirin-N domain-containing protein n=1 Tax=Sporothrix bragantina TaxID=671064 RepID=A0ABP0AZV0_9PEZI
MLKLPLLAVAGAVTAFSPPLGLHVGTDQGYNNGNDEPGGPAFPFADLCTSWHLAYLVDGGELSLWTQCPTQDASGAKVEVNALLPLESSLVATAQGIKPAYPSNSAPVSFSSVCRACTLPDPKGTVMACNCTTNGGDPQLAIDLTEWITADQGVPCFTDGVVCGTVQTTSAVSASSPTSSATKAAKETPKCTKT